MNKRLVYPLISLTTLLVSWEGLGRLFSFPNYILPVPSAIVEALVSDWHTLFKHSLVTLKEGVIGLVIASILASILAILMDRFKGLQLAIYPHLVISQTIPMMVLGPLLTVWFGFGLTPKILLVILMSFFPMAIAFFSGLQQVDPKYIQLMKHYGASTWQIYQLVKIPKALPGLLSGMRVAATYCIGGAIVGEWLSASQGLGYYMIRVKNGYLMDKVFAAILIVILLSLGLNLGVYGLEKLLQKKRMMTSVESKN